jgi:Domain of unknown function (DUF4159)
MRGPCGRHFGLAVVTVSLLGALLFAQWKLVPAGSRDSDSTSSPRPFRQYPGVEYPTYPLPDNVGERDEWVFARLMYPPAGFGRGFGGWGGWAQGNSSWTIDYPRGDRHMAAAVKRLTRIQARPFEQPVNLDDGDDVFHWPWLYAVEVGHWDLTDVQAHKLRDYLLRGGFLMVDDFHGTLEWQIFLRGIERVFPDRPIVDIREDDPIFHTLWDLNQRSQVPGLQFVYTHRTYEKDGYDPKWRAIYDDKGRIMVAICHNMDLGDSVEHSDNPRYPEKYSAEGMRVFLNYVIYAMTH